eukprot:6171991-Pleurochrysis_carterae.AAC.1
MVRATHLCMQWRARVCASVAIANAQRGRARCVCVDAVQRELARVESRQGRALPTCALPTCALPTCTLPTCPLPTSTLPTCERRETFSHYVRMRSPLRVEAVKGVGQAVRDFDAAVEGWPRRTENGRECKGVGGASGAPVAAPVAVVVAVVAAAIVAPARP